MIIFLGFMLPVVAMIGIRAGYMDGRASMQREAIKRGHAKMVRGDMFGLDYEYFEWIEEKK